MTSSAEISVSGPNTKVKGRLVADWSCEDEIQVIPRKLNVKKEEAERNPVVGLPH